MSGYADALAWLYRTQPRGIQPGLERIKRLLAALGDPHHAFPAFHVAGTNGKGSTAALIESALRTEGYRTGLYLSPHVTRFTERIQIEGTDIARDDVANALHRVRDASNRLADDAVHPTFFELVTAAAFHAFREAEIEVAVVEVGLGGRWDATNVVDPVASVVTNIGRDHMDRLGTTPDRIAAEKAGILRKDVAAVTGADGVALDVIRRTAADRSTPLTVEDGRTTRVLAESLDGTSFETDAWGRRRRFNLALLGRHQAMNATIAIRALERSGRFRVLPESAAEGFATVRLPGRLDRLPGETAWLLDGAHNPDAMRHLTDFLRRVAPGADVRLVFGILADKDLDGALDALTTLEPTMHVVDVPNVRTRPADEVAHAARGRGLDAAATALDEALERADRDPEAMHLVAGSLFLAGEVRRRLLGLEPDPIETPVLQ